MEYSEKQRLVISGLGRVGYGAFPDGLEQRGSFGRLGQLHSAELPALDGTWGHRNAPQRMMCTQPPNRLDLLSQPGFQTLGSVWPQVPTVVYV